MYGLVNKSMQDLVTTRFGAETWTRIRREAGVEHEAFVSMQAYPDAITYDLVKAASRELDIPVPNLLEAFGEHWVHDTGRQGYGDLMWLAGKTFVEFLQELDNMHGRIALTFPALTPPSFECTDVAPGQVRLHYHSTREGLAPMVVGLIRGLAGVFGLTGLAIEHDVRRSEGADHDEFFVRWGET
jgi:hypothetical protein